MSSQNTLNIWSRIFTKTGRPGAYTNLWIDLDDALKNIVFQEHSISPDEQPFIASIKNPDIWFLLTTDNIIWKSDSKITIKPIDSLKEARMDFHNIAKKYSYMKSDCNEINLEFFDGEKSIVCIEAGFPLGGIWNILLKISQKNISRQVR